LSARTSERDHHYLFLFVVVFSSRSSFGGQSEKEWSSSSVTQIISNLSVVLETLRKLFV